MENKSIRKTAIIFGAGKTGRGFIGYLCGLSGWNFVFVDKDEKLIANLKQNKSYKIKILNEKKENVEIFPLEFFTTDGNDWLEVFAASEVCFTAVFGNNLEKLSQYIVKGIEYRMESGNDSKLNIITCENLSHAALVLKKYIVGQMHNKESIRYLETNVGFVESIILKTCLSDPEGGLNLLVQDLTDLPCDLDGFKGSCPDIAGLKPMPNFQNQLIRKIYTYNCINAVLTYMGAEKGYTYLYEAAATPEIYKIAADAGLEASKALVAEFNFDPEEQKTWVENALKKFSDREIPDPIFRNGADPGRKLGKEDRLIGPANLALKHQINPQSIILGILAVLKYEDEVISMKSETDLHGIEWILQHYCNLGSKDQLFQLIKQKYNSYRR